MPESGAFTVDPATRTVRGILLPFGETSRLSMSKTEPVYFTADTVDVPADPSIVTLNREHDQFTPIGRATYLQKRREGVYAEFSIANTPEGDRYLSEEYPAGVFKKLSAEIAGLARDTADRAKAVAGRITGAALCTQGAFEHAALFAADTPADPSPAPVDPPAPGAGDETSQAAGTIKTTEEVKDLGNGKKRVTRTTVTVTEITEPDQPVDPTAEGDNPMPAATVPATLAASAANLVTPDSVKPDAASARDVFALITRAQKGDGDAEKMLAALTDIKVTGTGALPATGVLQPNWLGEVWKEKTYQQRYIPLLGHGDIKAIDEKGFTVSAAAEPVQKWSGNKSALPSSGGTTTLVTADFQRWAWAADIAREFFDIPGNEEVIAAFLRLVANSYARVTDKWALSKLVDKSTVVAKDTYPTLPTGSTDYPEAIKQLIQGVNYVSGDTVDDTPSFAVCNTLAWNQIIYAPADALPKWLTLDFGIQQQEGTASGVRVVRGDIGIQNTAAVLVGAKDAAHVNEMPGASPLTLSALDIANGGVDQATVGYTQFMADYPDALVTIGTDAFTGLG